MPKLAQFIQEKHVTVTYGNLPIAVTYSLDGASLNELMAMADVAKVIRGETTDIRSDVALAMVYQYLAGYVRSWDLEENDSTPEAPHYVELSEKRLTATGADKLPGNLIVAVFNALFEVLPTSPSASQDTLQNPPSSDSAESVTA